MNKISSMEFFWLMFMLYGCPYVLMLVHYLAKAGFGEAMVIILAAGIIAEIILYLTLAKAKNSNTSARKTWHNQVEKIILGIYFSLSALLNAAALTEMISAEFLNLTPKWVLAFFFILPALYLAKKNRRNIVWLAVILLPLSFFGYGILFLGNAAKFSLINILPINFTNDNFMFILRCFLPFCAQALAAAFFYPRLSAPQLAFRTASAALWVNLTLIFGQYFLACGVFGVIESRRILFIPIELAKILQIGNAALRVEAFSVWHWSVVGILSVAVFLNCLSVGKTKNAQKSKALIFVAGGLIVGILSIFDDLVALNFLVEVYSWATAGVLGGLFFLKVVSGREK